MLGNGRLEAFCFDGVNRLCHIRGKLRKRVWIGVVHGGHAICHGSRVVSPTLLPRQGDIVLLGLREFQDQKADIIMKYDGGVYRSQAIALSSARGREWSVPHTGALESAACVPCGMFSSLLNSACTTADEARGLKAYGELPETGAKTRPACLCIQSSARRACGSANQCRHGGPGRRGIWRRQFRFRRERPGRYSRPAVNRL